LKCFKHVGQHYCIPAEDFSSFDSIFHDIKESTANQLFAQMSSEKWEKENAEKYRNIISSGSGLEEIERDTECFDLDCVVNPDQARVFVSRYTNSSFKHNFLT
jgi:hypothetical protein